jgi:hypothetical protein
MIKYIISCIFSLPVANFICVASVLVYLIKTRVIPLIDQGIADKEAARQQLKEAVHYAQVEREMVEGHSQEQKLYAQELINKLAIWNTAVDVVRAQETKFKQQGTRAITALIKKQEESLLTIYLAQAVTPTIMKDATEKLTVLFSEKDKNKVFLNRAFDDLKQEKL